jgi:hypothetical protein
VPDLHPETQGPPDPGDATIELLREIGGPADEISRFVDAGVISGRQE